jgi:propionyl-CoA synthetase
LNSLRAIFVAGEHCDLETKHWIEKTFKVPVLNHWWQTETGSAITASSYDESKNMHLPNFTTGLPFVGYDIKIMESSGKGLKELGPNELGRIVVKLPLPPGNMSTFYRNDDLFEKVYFQRYPGFYDTMDAGYRDENGFIFVTARDDDVRIINFFLFHSFRSLSFTTIFFLGNKCRRSSDINKQVSYEMKTNFKTRFISFF